MPKRSSAVARLAVAVGFSLTAAACSAAGAKPAPVTAAAAPARVAAKATAEPTAKAAPKAAKRRVQPTSPSTATTICLPPTFDPTRAAWQDIDAALKEASVDHEPVLLDFGASWCSGCAQLQQAFQDPEVQALVRTLHMVRVDAGPPGAATNMDIAAAYGLNLEKTGIPGLILLSPLGRVEATTDDGLFDNDLPNSPSEIIGFLQPHL
jgi:thiol:disulfide interchange protein